MVHQSQDRVMRTADSFNKCIQWWLHRTAPHSTAVHCTAPHCTALHCTVMSWTALHCTALHRTALQCTTRGYMQIYVKLRFQKIFSSNIQLKSFFLLSSLQWGFVYVIESSAVNLEFDFCHSYQLFSIRIYYLWDYGFFLDENHLRNKKVNFFY